MSDYLSSVLDELVPTYADENGGWERVVADAGAGTPTTTAHALPADATSSAERGGRQGRWPVRWLTRRRLVAVGLTALLAALLVTPALGLGSRLLDLIQDKPPLREMRGAVWSPDGRKIVYLSRRGPSSWDLNVIDADGSGQLRLASSVSRSAPTWSPDGRKVAFRRLRRGGMRWASDLYVINVDGSRERWLAAKGFNPAWSPDGREIAFAARSGIYVMNTDGSGRRRLAGTTIGVPGIGTGLGSAFLAWSPDGRKLVFASDAETSCDFCFHLYVVNADGSAARRLTHTTPPRGNFAPAWSPNGRRIAFVRAIAPPGRFRNLGAVWVMNADGSAQRELTRGALGWRDAASYAALAWSPDGRKLAFTSARDGNAEVYTVNSDGSGLRRLTDSPEYDGDAAWSPDGRSLVFVSNRDGNSAVYVMNGDGSGQRKLTQLEAGG